MKKIFVFLIVMFFFTSCGGKSESQEKNLDVSDPAKILEAAVGSEFKIVMDSNPSTGYHWELNDDLDETIVKFVSKDFNNGGLSAPGSGGRDVWIFKAITAGATHITLEYYSPSNELAEPQQKVTFVVTVK